MKLLLMVFVGGGAGSLLRYALSLWLRTPAGTLAFPWATLAANLTGCFLIGLFYGLSARLNLSNEVRLLLTTGLCGGFTTFSTFSYESLQLLRQGGYGYFALYVGASIALGILLALCGVALAEALLASRQQ